MPITVQKLTAPKILVTGTVIFQGNLIPVVDLDLMTEIIETTIIVNGHTITQVIHIPQLRFIGNVTVKMTTVYPLKAMPAIPPVGNVEVGDYPDIPYNLDKAAIYYTVNGKDPKRTKNSLYLQQFVLTSNKSGSDNTVIKARVYKEGDWSNVTTVNIIVVEI